MRAVVCQLDADYEGYDDEIINEQSSMLYPIFGCISSLFLFLVVVLYFLIPEMRTLQNKSVMFQSATLAIGLVGVTVLHFYRDLFKYPYACHFFGKQIQDISLF
jgi:hypothetical protein